MELIKPSIISPSGEELESIALRHIRIEGEIDEFFARYKIQQSFINTESEPLEIIYTFPVRSRAILEDFKAKIGDTTIRTWLLSRKEAEKRYEEAVIRGNTSINLEMHRTNVLTLNIGNLAPFESLTVQLHLLELLEVNGGKIRLLFPTVIGPRYIPGRPAGGRTGFGWANPTDEVPDADWITPPISPEGVPYRVSLSLKVRNNHITSVKSPSHPIKVSVDDDCIEVNLALNERANRDIVLDIGVDEEVIKDELIVADYNDRKVALMWVKPDREFYQKRNKTPRRVIFVLDRSGSMAGEKLESSKRALRLCLRQLNQGDMFNIVAFSDDATLLSHEWLPLNENSLKFADSWIENIGAGGGTEMLHALNIAFQFLSGMEGETLVLLTDGQVGNEDSVARLFKRRGKNLKVLLFGIDTAVNEDLFTKILETATGVFETIYPGEPLEETVIKQFKGLHSSALENLEISKVKIQRTYPRLPIHLKENSLTPLMLEIKGDLEGSASVLLEYEDGKADSRTLKVTKKRRYTPLLKIWAARKLRRLEDDVGIYQAESSKRGKLRKEIEKLALEFGLQSSMTNWAAILERKNKITDLAKIQIVPMEPVLGWDMLKNVSPKITFSASRRFNPEPKADCLKRAVDTIDTFFDLMLKQRADGSFILNGLTKDILSTILVLLFLLLLAKRNGKDISPYLSIIEKSLEYILFKVKKNGDIRVLLPLLLEELSLELPGIKNVSAYAELMKVI